MKRVSLAYNEFQWNVTSLFHTSEGDSRKTAWAHFGIEPSDMFQAVALSHSDKMLT